MSKPGSGGRVRIRGVGDEFLASGGLGISGRVEYGWRQRGGKAGADR